MRALVVDSSEGRGSLAAVRALGRAGWSVGIGCPSRTGLPMVSRWAHHRHLAPPHASGEDAFLEAIDGAIADRGYELVFGCSDGEILTLSRERDKLAAKVPYPPHETMLRAIDKVDLGAAARAVSLAIPPEAASAAEGREQWGDKPVVVKERMHGTQAAGGAFTHLPPQAFNDSLDAGRREEEIRAAGGTPVLQRLIEGKLMAFTSVRDQQGNMLARVQQVAERTYPRDAGLSVRARTVPVDEELAAKISLLLCELGWFGLSELQFIQPFDSDPVLLDFNGRFYGSLALALAAGVNLPDTWARSAMGRGPVQGGDAHAGVRYQWLEGDLRAARERSRGALRDAGSCARYAIGAHDGIWSPGDPLPGLLTAGTIAGQVARLAVQRRGRAPSKRHDEIR